MNLFALDTDTPSLYYEGNTVVRGHVDAHPAGALAITALTVDEQLAGWYTVARQARRPEHVAVSPRQSFASAAGASSATRNRPSLVSGNGKPCD